MKTTIGAIWVDYEYNAEAWWDAARDLANSLRDPTVYSVVQRARKVRSRRMFRRGHGCVFANCREAPRVGNRTKTRLQFGKIRLPSRR